MAPPLKLEKPRFWKTKRSDPVASLWAENFFRGIGTPKTTRSSRGVDGPVESGSGADLGGVGANPPVVRLFFGPPQAWLLLGNFFFFFFTFLLVVV